MDRKLPGVFALLDDVGDHLNVPRRRVLAAGPGLVPLAEITRLEIGFEEDRGVGEPGPDEPRQRAPEDHGSRLILKVSPPGRE